MNIALLTASGVGSRMHCDIPKQFICVNDRPIILYTIESFERHPDIDAILVACLDGWENIIWAYAKQAGIKKLKWIVKGGATGQESICAGLNEISKTCTPDDIVLIHDGNRPLVPQDVITNSIVTCNKFGSAVSYVPCTEVVFVKEPADGSLQSSTIIDRDTLLRTQTPHTFPLQKLQWAYEEAEKRYIPPQVASCALMSVLGEKIHFSLGSELNFKITTPADLEIFRALLSVKRRGMCEV